MKITAIPQVYRNVNRWREILSVLSKYGLADWLSRFDLEFPKGWLKDRDGEALARQTRENRIRLALTELGPTFIKLGQILSTRPDVVGVSLAAELEKLQSDVVADRPEVVRQVVEQELGQPVEDIFADFDDESLASASIGQVHRARLASGEEVVIKVQHSNIEEKVRVDLDILSGLAQLAEKMPEFVNYRPRATVAEFQRVLRRELDFGREERNMQQFYREFADNPSVKIPHVYVDLSTSRVLTMEYIKGIKLSQCHQVAAAGFELDQVARRGAELYLEMIFTHGFYHADPHAGNILLLDGNVIGLLDYGMVGRIDEALREEMEDLLMSIIRQDDVSLTAVIMRVGEVPLDLDENALRGELADFVSHYGNQPMATFRLASALNEMMEIIRRFQIMLPAQIALLLKTLVMLEGTARTLNPEFSLIEVMRRFSGSCCGGAFHPLDA